MQKHLIFALLLAATALPAAAGQQSAAMGVSVQVLASCRVDTAAQVARPSQAVLSAASFCSGSTRPATQAVVETQRADMTPVSVRLQQESGSASEDRAHSTWVRLDVIY